MKRWALLMLIGYLAVAALLAAPFVWLVLGPWYGAAGTPAGSWEETPREMLGAPGFWILYLIPSVVAVFLLLAPMGPVPRRWKGRRPVFWSVLAVSLAATLLLVAGGLSLSVAVLDTDPISWLADTAPVEKLLHELRAAGWEDAFVVAWPIVALLSLWAGWAFVFSVAARRQDPDKVPERLVKWMLRGSILEFITALICHILVRRRNECCAAAFTLIGLSTGFGLMLVAFGPGTWILLQLRKKRLQPARE